MNAPATRLPYALTAYSLPHVMGYIPTQDKTPNPAPLGTMALLDRAAAYGLQGAEFPLSARVPSFNGTWVEVPGAGGDVRAALEARGLRVLTDYGAILDRTADELRDALTESARAGATVMRVILSNLLCGDRRKVPDWEGHLTALAARLREVLPHAEQHGLAIAVENHQDMTSEDLFSLAERVGNHPAFGVTLDTGNPLSVGEDPVLAARRLAPLIRHLHLKDYTLHFAPNGYHLVRCAAGTGVVDFPAILGIMAAHCPHPLLPGIEIAAQQTRTIPILEDDWWACYPLAQKAELPAVLRLLWEKGRPLGEPYASAWERGGDSAAVCAEEWDVLDRSVAYFRSLAESGAV